VSNTHYAAPDCFQIETLADEGGGSCFNEHSRRWKSAPALHFGAITG
jgi:hypothetical protein